MKTIYLALPLGKYRPQVEAVLIAKEQKKLANRTKKKKVFTAKDFHERGGVAEYIDSVDLEAHTISVFKNQKHTPLEYIYSRPDESALGWSVENMDHSYLSINQLKDLLLEVLKRLFDIKAQRQEVNFMVGD